MEQIAVGEGARWASVDIGQHVERVVDGQGAVVADLQAAGRSALVAILEGEDCRTGVGRLRHVAVLQRPRRKLSKQLTS